MTGTPAANRPYDIWAQIKFLDGGEALGASFESFKQAMDLPTERSVTADNAANLDTASRAERSDTADYAGRLDTIHQRLAPFTVRETKDTAGIHLPEKTVTAHFVDLPAWQMAKYTAYRDELAYEYDIDGVAQTDNVEIILKRLLRLVQCASNPALIDGRYDTEPGKYVLLLDMCRQLACQSKLIIWTGFVENVDWLAAKLAKSPTLKDTLLPQPRAMTRLS